MRVLAAYGSSAMQISDNTNGKNRKKQYNNTEFRVLENWFGVFPAAPGVRIRGGPPAAGERSPCSWLITEWSYVKDCCINISMVITACCISWNIVT